MKKHIKKPASAKLPKGAYRLPTGRYITVGKPSSGKHPIHIVAVHKDPPDIEELAKALLILAEGLAKREHSD